MNTSIPTGIHTSYVVHLYAMNSLLTWMCTHYTHALHMYLRLVFVYMPKTNNHSFGKRGKGCGQARLVGTCTCAIMCGYTQCTESSQNYIKKLNMNTFNRYLYWYSYKLRICLYAMNSLLTWMCTHYTHALHMYLVFVYMPRINSLA